ncbi:MAG: tRNA adenosine(34) deaminase TadA [Candidatus Aminicenantales bacterium]
MGKRPKFFLNDEAFMKLALKEAKKAIPRGEVPVGAVIIADSKVLARAHNQPRGRQDPTAHAEILALRSAARKRQNYRLPDCVLYVTLEPCTMCLGAAVQARIKRVVYAAADPKAGAVESVLQFPWERLNHRPEIQGGVLEKEARELLQLFFKARRKPRASKT